MTAENIQVRGELIQMSTNYEQVSQQRDELSSTVKLAQKLNAKNVVVAGLNESSKEKDKTKKIAKIRTCFTVLENNVAIAGNKMICSSSREKLLSILPRGSLNTTMLILTCVFSGM